MFLTACQTDFINEFPGFSMLNKSTTFVKDLKLSQQLTESRIRPHFSFELTAVTTTPEQ